jgi:uncharacterized membrane protein
LTNAASRANESGLAAARLGAGALVGVLALAGALLAAAPWAVAVSAGWDAAALVFLAWVWLRIAGLDAEASARVARAEDFSRATADAVLLSASVASLAAVGFTLGEAGRGSGTDKGLLIALAIVTVALAWAAVHTVFTLRYGDLYYEPPVGGIVFHSDDRPDFRDFAYVAVTVGMTFQVSDTDLTTKAIRRTAVRHALLSFVFGTVVVAITVNIVASLLNR